MAGFNYGGGPGDGTSWSSERGNEPSPGGGRSGNAGERDAGKNAQGSSQSTTEAINLRTVGDKLARSFGILPTDFFGYFIEGGHIFGLSKTSTVEMEGVESPAWVDLGPIPPELQKENNSHDNSPDSLEPISSSYQGDISDGRIAALKKIIDDNYALAHSTQTGRRITKARDETLQAQYELGLIGFVRQKRAEKKN